MSTASHRSNESPRPSQRTPLPAESIETARVRIGIVDGSEMAGYLARPTTPGPHPGAVVGTHLFGVDAEMRAVCDRLAALGVIALAPDLNHRTEPGAELPRDEAGRARGFALLDMMTRAQVVADHELAAAYLRTLGCDRVGALGLSVGGHAAYLAAASGVDLDPLAVLYGGWLPTTQIALSRPEPTLDLTPAIRGRVLFLVGADDHVVPKDHRHLIAEALRAAGTRHQFVVYPGVGHAFLGADPQATDDAWRRIHALFRGDSSNSGNLRPHVRTR
jgi:carboxymethylenebutenolidase